MDIINDYCLECKENPLRSEIVMSDSNPGHIAQTIAPLEPSETAEVLVEIKKSRIKNGVNVIPWGKILQNFYSWHELFINVITMLYKF